MIAQNITISTTSFRRSVYPFYCFPVTFSKNQCWGVFLHTFCAFVFDIHYHFIRDVIAKGQVIVGYIPPADQQADVLT